MPGPAPTPGQCPFGGHPSRLFFRRKAAPEQSGVLGLGPPRLRWAAAGLARRPCLRLGLAPGLGPCGPLGRAGPGSGPLRSLWVAPGVAAACRRAACAPCGGRGAPPGPRRCGVWGACPRRPWLAVGCGPVLAGLAPRLLSLAAPCGGAALLPPGGCAPAASGRVPPRPAPVGRPGYRHGPPPLRPSGGRLGAGRKRPALDAAAAPRTSGQLDKNRRSIISYDCGQNGGKQAERWKNGGEF